MCLEETRWCFLVSLVGISSVRMLFGQGAKRLFFQGWTLTSWVVGYFGPICHIDSWIGFDPSFAVPQTYVTRRWSLTDWLSYLVDLLCCFLGQSHSRVHCLISQLTVVGAERKSICHGTRQPFISLGPFINDVGLNNILLTRYAHWKN